MLYSNPKNSFQLLTAGALFLTYQKLESLHDVLASALRPGVSVPRPGAVRVKAGRESSCRQVLDLYASNSLPTRTSQYKRGSRQGTRVEEAGGGRHGGVQLEIRISTHSPHILHYLTWEDNPADSDGPIGGDKHN
ncbi:hypothetical protein RRG08_039999 [Elysia crispata]|uniref:Uncharacterized protein n=1 Tax=Elysia crispata TaxID=231223 RepID=A0AAE0Z7W6_9GAST|nr:hypothetical protein RRG08_039999 [Elysia crispata]